MKRLTLGLAFAAALSAQSGAPPTYDYDAATPGTQAPFSPLLAGYTYRSVRTYQVAIPVLVPLQELQAALPPGYIPVATPAGSNTATIALTFFLDQRFQPAVGGQTYGPATALLATTTVMNNSLATPRMEIVFPIFETAAGEAELNAAFGPGSARTAKVNASLEEEDGKLHFKFKVKDKGIGMDIVASAVGSMDINTRSVSDPVGLPFRALNGFQGNQAFRGASQSDTLVLSAQAAKAKVDTPGDRLQMKTGSVTIVGIGPNVTFSRGVEFVIKFE